MGGSECLVMAFQVILNHGDDVLMPEPYYSNYSTFIAMAGGNMVPVKTYPEEGYNFANIDRLEAAVTDKTKAIVCISPGNPTGFVLTAEEMDRVAEFAIKHDLWIISDEAYREFVYDGRKAGTFASIDKIADRLIIIDSVSKRYSACGARVGYIASKNPEFMDGVMKISQGRLCTPTIDQVGAAELFRMPKEYYEEMRAEYEGRRDACYSEISQIPDVVCQKPGGAFYVTIDLPIDDAEDFLMFMLTEYRDNNETVMFAPAAGFYATPGAGKSEIRLAYVLNRHDLRRACELIKKGLAAYRAKYAK
jgi:aspartate aminotransferase